MDMVKTITVEGRQYEFICRSWGTRHGFAHGCEMFDRENWKIVATAKRYYINRTWENWDFQSCILDAVDKALDAHVDVVRSHIMKMKNWKRLSENRRDYICGVLEDDPEYYRLMRLYFMMRESNPAWD